MENKEYLEKWERHSDIFSFSLDNVYSVLIKDEKDTIDDFLDFVHIDKSKLITSESEKVNQSLEKIDDLMLDIAEYMRVFIIDNLFSDISDDDFFNNYQQLKSDVENLYSELELEIVKIRNEIKLIT